MKKLVFILFSVLVLTGCKSKEERAEEAVEAYVKSLMFNEFSYYPIETQVSEAYVSAYNDTTIIKEIKTVIPLEKELQQYNSQLETIIKKINLPVQEYYGKLYLGAKFYDWNRTPELLKYKVKVDALCDTIASINQQIQDNSRHIHFYPLLEKESIGWNVIHRFGGKNQSGYDNTGIVYCVFDKDFKNILFYQDLTDPEYLQVKDYIEKNMKSAIRGDLQLDD